MKCSNNLDLADKNVFCLLQITDMRTIKTESPDVGRAMQRKALNYRSNYAAFWAVVNVVLTVLTSVEMYVIRSF